MKLIVNDLYQINPILAEAYKKDLPAGVAIAIKRLISAMQKEIADIDPTRMKVVTKYSKGKEKAVVNGNEVDSHILPKRDDKNFAEFMKEFQEVLNVKVEVPYEPIDIDLLVKRLDKSETDISPDILDVLDTLNKLYNIQKEEAEKKEEKKEEPEPDTTH